jgi:hypothetical protein
MHTTQEVHMLGIWVIDWEGPDALNRARSDVKEDLHASLMLGAFIALVGKSP